MLKFHERDRASCTLYSTADEQLAPVCVDTEVADALAPQMWVAPSSLPLVMGVQREGKGVGTEAREEDVEEEVRIVVRASITDWRWLRANKPPL